MGPETLAIMSAVAAVSSAGMQAFSMVSGANQQAGYSAYNAQIAQRNADAARASAASEAGDLRKKGAAAQGEVRAQLGALGLLPDEGSPYELLLDNAEQIELDAQRRIFRGEREAEGHLSQAQLDLARTDTTGSYLAAGGSLLAGGAKAFQYLKIFGGGGASGGGAAAP